MVSKNNSEVYLEDVTKIMNIKMDILTFHLALEFLNAAWNSAA